MKNLTIHLSSIAPMLFYGNEQPHLPVLEMLVSRGNAQPFSLAGDSNIFAEMAQENISYAQLRLAGEGEQPQESDSGYWYCADPVYLKADRDQVILSHPAIIQIQDSEADALISVFNQLFKEDGIALWRATTGVESAERWYLRSDKPWQLSTTPLEQAESGSIRERMPQGADAQRWRKVIAEVEMLFFAHPVNRQRGEMGAPLISSLWLWGEQQQISTIHLPWDLLVGKHPLLKGISRLQQIPLLPDSAPFDEIIDKVGNGLMVVDSLLSHQRLGRYGEISAALLDLEQRIFAPALQALKQKKVEQLTIQPANGKIYKIRRHHLMRFWSRGKLVWASMGQGN